MRAEEHTLGNIKELLGNGQKEPSDLLDIDEPGEDSWASDEVHLSSIYINPNVENIVFTICSGAQEGASTLLTRGKNYAVGRDLTSDIVLFDETVESKHISIRYEENRIHLFNVMGICTVDGVNIAHGIEGFSGVVSNKLNIQLRIGEIDLYIGNKQLSENIEPVTETVDLDETAKNKPHSILKAYAKYLYLLAALVTFMLFFFTVFYTGSIDKGLSRNDLIGSISEQLDKYSIKNQTLSLLGRNGISVGGYVVRSGDYENLSSMLQNYGGSVSNNLSSLDEIKTDVNSLLLSFGLGKGIEAIFDSAGNLRFKGVVGDKQQWMLFSEVLTEDVTYVKDFDDSRVITIDELVKSISPIFTAYDLPSQLSVVRVGEEIMIRGEVDPDQLESLETEVSKIRKRLSGYPTISTQIKEAADPLAGLVIKLLSNTSRPYIILDSGQKYRKGDELENGYVLESIEDEKVVFEKSGTKLEVSI